VLVATSEFKVLAESIAKFQGYPNLPMVVVPRNFTTMLPDEVAKLADELMEQILGQIADEVDPEVLGGGAAE
jgi:hypothetical protein